MGKLNFELLNKAKKKVLLKELANYGIEKLPYLVIKWGKRLRIFSGTLDKETIFKLLREVNVDSIGLYFASTEGGLRLSVDALHLRAEQINRGVIEINDKQVENWFNGENIELNQEQKREVESFHMKFLILKNKGDIIGMGKKSSYGIANSIPQERRIKK